MLDNNKICFKRSDLVRGECTRTRNGKDLAQEYLCQEYERDIVILRILDRPKEVLKLPRPYKLKSCISVIDVVTNPEIEILHIIAEGLEADFERRKAKSTGLKPSEYCKMYLPVPFSKSADFVNDRYANNVDKLVMAIERHRDKCRHEKYCLGDLIEH